MVMNKKTWVVTLCLSAAPCLSADINEAFKPLLQQGQRNRPNPQMYNQVGPGTPVSTQTPQSDVPRQGWQNPLPLSTK